MHTKSVRIGQGSDRQHQAASDDHGHQAASDSHGHQAERYACTLRTDWVGRGDPEPQEKTNGEVVMARLVRRWHPAGGLCPSQSSRTPRLYRDYSLWAPDTASSKSKSSLGCRTRSSVRRKRTCGCRPGIGTARTRRRSWGKMKSVRGAGRERERERASERVRRGKAKRQASLPPRRVR